mmetsp:Transcript_27249/g.78990  ORF Transcript_27249/g.78990 Transcript_27249/m.78990 type:complete len:202 (+) Transcript_27249:3428-4033(+)
MGELELLQVGVLQHRGVRQRHGVHGFDYLELGEDGSAHDGRCQGCSGRASSCCGPEIAGEGAFGGVVRDHAAMERRSVKGRGGRCRNSSSGAPFQCGTAGVSDHHTKRSAPRHHLQKGDYESSQGCAPDPIRRARCFHDLVRQDDEYERCKPCVPVPGQVYHARYRPGGSDGRPAEHFRFLVRLRGVHKEHLWVVDKRTAD